MARNKRQVETQNNKNNRNKNVNIVNNPGNGKKFRLNFLNTDQQLAWAVYQQHEVVFLLGAAGTGKTHLAMAFAIYDILRGDKKKIILTRPIVEAGESLGYLPGDFEEKVNPYMLPLFDVMDRLVGDVRQREIIKSSIEIAPLAYMRGRSFHNAVCIFDEAQNATATQLKLFLTRFGENSKIIITGDPQQSDLRNSSDLLDVVHRVEPVSGVGIVRFKRESIVRHPMVAAILERFEE